MPWLGPTRGHLTDWATQRWVRLTGRPVELAREAWLDGLTGSPAGIGRGFFEAAARAEGLELREAPGLLRAFADLGGPGFDPAAVHPEVARFYEETSAYAVDAWTRWRGPFRPFGTLLARLFSRRLQQLNVPLSPLDTSRGVTSRVLHLVDPATGQVRHTGWLRQLNASGDVLFAGSYSVSRLPGKPDPCVKALFPLPNGNAVVFLEPAAHPDGSLTLHSRGRRFGEAGFYFTVHEPGGRVWARYVRPMHERMHLYPAPDGGVRADHVFSFAGAPFLQIHYRLQRA